MTTTFATTNEDDGALATARLLDPDPNVRRVAILALADEGDPNAIPRFVQVLREDAAHEVRQAAAFALAEWERDDVVEALCFALTDAHQPVREAAAQGLAELKDGRSASVLLKWAGHREPFVREAVLRGLRELRSADAFAVAMHALSDEVPSLRSEAIAVLGWLKDPRALKSLAALATSDPEANVRRAATSTLGFAADEDESVAAALLIALRDDTWQVREQAAATLGKLRASLASERLIAALDDPYWQVRLSAVRSLGQLREIRAAFPIAELLRHPIGNLRKEAALALGEIKAPDTLDSLRDALHDGDPDVRKSARIAIAQIEEAGA
jgi:HEAT repeat protein